MTKHEDFIDQVLATPKSRTIVKTLIPLFIRWAKLGRTDSTYKETLVVLGYKKGFSGISRQLSYVDDVMKALSKKTGEEIPTLNTFCKSSDDLLPSAGFDYVYPTYSKMSIEEKKVFVAGLDYKAFQYQKWDWVLEQLGLKPQGIFDDDEIEEQRVGASSFGLGGEGIEHKAIKEYLFNHPESIGLDAVNSKAIEYNLPSGDRLDVFFALSNGIHFAIEVKPSSSPNEDITRGIFQCVKYKAVMDAARAMDGGCYNNSTLLVMAGKMSNENRRLAHELGLKVIEEFICDKK